MHCICAKLKDLAVPSLVLLGKGRVREAVRADFSRLVGVLYHDPDLDVCACISTLLATCGELLVRFHGYELYPYKAAEMCAEFNPTNFRTACIDFLRAPDATLDTGFGLPLKRLAMARGTELDAVQFLLSTSVQAALHKAFAASAASSLPAERRFAELKRGEAPRLCHVAVAGRNQQLRQFLRWRQERLARKQQADKELKKSMKLNKWSLAWNEMPEAVGQPVGSFAPVILPMKKTAIAKYVRSRDAELQTKIRFRREAARAAAEKQHSKVTPLQFESWVDWFAEHDDDFNESMKSAAQKRRGRSRRLTASEGMPQGARRLQPRAHELDSKRAWPRWCELLKGRKGWYGLKMTDSAPHVFFLFHHRGVSFCLDFTGTRRQGVD